jgi:amidohydrolase
MPPALGHSPWSAAIAAALPHYTAVRRDLHAHPEIAYQEHRTSDVIRRELAALGIAHVGGLAGGTGVIAHLPATDPASSAGTVGLRADIDALPITEQTGLAYSSTIPGRMHACGHDGHTATLLATARVLRDAHRPRPVTFVFQPAEEGGAGAEKLCHEGALDGRIIGPRVERMFGLHGWPDMPLGTVGSRPGPLLASTDELRVLIRGVQAHAAYPHIGRDPVLAMSACIVALQQVASRNVAPTDAVVVSTCIVQAGSASNVIPQTASFVSTLRTLRPSTRELAKRRISEIVQGTALAHDCTAEIAWEDGYPVTHNDPALTEHFFTHADAMLGGDRVIRVETPTMGGEDFAYYAQRVPSVFFCLGLKPAHAERAPQLHQPDFDFNDDAMPIGIELFCRLATT